MLFNSFLFFGFLAIVLPLYYALAHQWQNRLLLVASYVFYAAWDWRFLSLLFIQTVVDFVCARAMEVTATAGRRRLCLIISLCVNLGMLAFFKYFNFFVNPLANLLRGLGLGLSPIVLQVVLPPAISFYTFQTLAYTIDVYRRRAPATDDFPAFALYVSYFPHLVAGPIMRPTHLLPQLQNKRLVTPGMVATGVQLMLMGYLKKVGIADPLTPYVEKAFSNPGMLSSPALVLSLYLFAIQIYCDFSGYSDIARGVSRLFGIELNINFMQPYLSRNISEFWRRWHISLSTWLRDYLYIPLGGNRHGSFKTYRNLMVTMLLGGLWHGASWTFVAWGALHGTYLAVQKLFSRGRESDGEPVPCGTREWLAYWLQVVATFQLVCLAWIFFRAPDFESAGNYLKGIFCNGFTSLGLFGPLAALGFYGGLMLLLDYGCLRHQREFPLSERSPVLARGFAYAGALLIISFVGGDQVVPFIYFQF